MATNAQPIAVIARLLDLSERRIQQLSREGVIPKAERGQYDLVAAVRGYVAYLRDLAVKAQAGAPDFGAERARLIKAKADLAEMEADGRRGELLPADAVEAAWTAVLARLRAGCWCCPTALAPLCHEETTIAGVRDQIRKAVREALDELAATPVVAADPDGAGAAGDGGAAALSILRPPPELSISDWADANRRLSSEASAEPGQWRTSRAEYQRGIMDAISDGAVESVVIMSRGPGGQERSAGNCRRLLHRPGPGADHAGDADRARRRGLVEGPLLADGARHAVPHGQDIRPEVARRLEQDPAQALPGRAPDHRRRQRARRGARPPARPHLALRRGRPLSGFSAGAEGDPVILAEEARSVTFANGARCPGLDADDPRPQPHRARIRGERPAAVLRACPHCGVHQC